MKKNLSNLNSDILSRRGFSIERSQEHWSVYKISGNNKAYTLTFKKPVSELFDLFNENTNTEELLSTLPDCVALNSTDSAAPAFNATLSAVSLQDNIVPLKKKSVAIKSKHITSFDSETTSLLYTKKNPSSSYEGFYFPDFTDSLINRIKAKRNTLLTGPSGSGKSELIQKLADYYGQTLIRINFSTGITPSDLIGRFVVKNGETVFAYGFIPLAMEKGFWILLDEIDYAQPEHLSCLQAVLEGNPLVLTQSEGEIIHPHSEFRLFATANTKGRGDTSESYSGTSFLNMAFLDRWSMFEMDYSKKEKNILAHLVDDSQLVSKTIDMFSLFRKAIKSGDISNAVFSTRRMIMFIEALKMGDTLEDALTYEILNRYHSDESDLLLEYAKDIFDYNHYFKGNWRLGMAHHSPLDTVQAQVQNKTDI